jgi:hypothetical protein
MAPFLSGQIVLSQTPATGALLRVDAAGERCG